MFRTALMGFGVALFLAGIRPTLSAMRLSRPRAERLRTAIRDVLGRA